MDDEMRDRARDVFVALTGVETGSTTLEAFEDVFNNDFSAWRVFFRAVKDLTADNESALAELSGGGFLNDITISNWGKSVKERSELFREEFVKFMGLSEVRRALASDLGCTGPPPPSPIKPASPAAMAAVAASVASPAPGTEPEPSVVPTTQAAAATTTTETETAVVEALAPPLSHGDAQDKQQEQHQPPQPPVISFGGDSGDDEATVTAAFHRERVLAYLGGFKGLLLSLQEHLDAVATANVMRVGAELDAANNRLDKALENVERMITAESGDEAPRG